MARMLPFLKLLTVFLVAFSLASLSGPMSSNFHLPSIQPAHAIVPLCVAVQCGHCDVMIGSYCNGYWVPGGASEDTFRPRSSLMRPASSPTYSQPLRTVPFGPELDVNP